MKFFTFVSFFLYRSVWPMFCRNIIYIIIWVNGNVRLGSEAGLLSCSHFVKLHFWTWPCCYRLLTRQNSLVCYIQYSVCYWYYWYWVHFCVSGRRRRWGSFVPRRAGQFRHCTLLSPCNNSQGYRLWNCDHLTYHNLYQVGTGLFLNEVRASFSGKRCTVCIALHRRPSLWIKFLGLAWFYKVMILKI